MSDKVFINYWIGQEPTPPSPGLGDMPSQVTIAPLAFVGINDAWQLDFSFLCKTNSAEQIKQWIQQVKANGTKVVFSIGSSQLGVIPDIEGFAGTVVDSVIDWGVDGVDLDCEPPPADGSTLVQLTAALRQELDERVGDSVITAPVYSPWLDSPALLKNLAAELDYVTTMDYTPYPGLGETKQLVNQYVKAIGSAAKVVVGVSCMQPQAGNFTPLDDVVELCHWESDAGPTGGMMLYTYSYDITTRRGGGTGLPNYAFSTAIIENLQ